MHSEQINEITLKLNLGYMAFPPRRWVLEIG